MKILFTICGRAGSKGIINKNLKDFNGFPLPLYTLSIIDMFIKKNIEHECTVVLNTDSEELIHLFKDKIIIPVQIIRRAPQLSNDSVPKVWVIKNSYETMKERMNTDFDIVVDLDVTSPLRTMNDLENLILKASTCEADVVFSVTNSRRNPFFNMVMKTGDGFERVIKSNYNTRQEAPEIYDMNASMYAYKTKFLLSGKGIFEGNVDIIQMLDTGILDIDHENDLVLMEIIGKYFFENYADFNQVYKNIEYIIE